MPTKVKRRVCEITKKDVCYEDLIEPLVIWRSIEEHMRTQNKSPEIGDLVDFDSYYEWYDGNYYEFSRGEK